LLSLFGTGDGANDGDDDGDCDGDGDGVGYAGIVLMSSFWTRLSVLKVVLVLEQFSQERGLFGLDTSSRAPVLMVRAPCVWLTVKLENKKPPLIHEWLCTSCNVSHTHVPSFRRTYFTDSLLNHGAMI